MQKIVLAVLVLALVALFVSDANAQSGWILWESISWLPRHPKVTDSWRLVAAFPTYDNCIAAANYNCEQGIKLARELTKSLEKTLEIEELGKVKILGIEPEGNRAYGIAATTSKAGPFIVFHRFQCFPSDFDPRK